MATAGRHEDDGGRAQGVTRILRPADRDPGRKEAVRLDEADTAQTYQNGRLAHETKGTTMSERLSGTVKSFRLENGYGFIIPDGGGSDVFTHHKQVKGLNLSPDALLDMKGLRISYELGVNKINGRIIAVKLELMEKPKC
jgi:cold shock CspA family protein